MTYSFGDKRFEHCGPIVDHADGLRLAYQMFTPARDLGRLAPPTVSARHGAYT